MKKPIYRPHCANCDRELFFRKDGKWHYINAKDCPCKLENVELKGSSELPAEEIKQPDEELVNDEFAAEQTDKPKKNRKMVTKVTGFVR